MTHINQADLQTRILRNKEMLPQEQVSASLKWVAAKRATAQTSRHLL